MALDTQPYGGATTTCEALGMGVPVICLAGDGMVGRLSSSILKSADCSEWIANTEKEYINQAVKQIRKGVRDKKKREQLRDKIKKSNLCDKKRLARELERIYVEALDMEENDCSR